MPANTLSTTVPRTVDQLRIGFGLPPSGKALEVSQTLCRRCRQAAVASERSKPKLFRRLPKLAQIKLAEGSGGNRLCRCTRNCSQSSSAARPTIGCEELSCCRYFECEVKLA